MYLFNLFKCFLKRIFAIYCESEDETMLVGPPLILEGHSVKSTGSIINIYFEYPSIKIKKNGEQGFQSLRLDILWELIFDKPVDNGSFTNFLSSLNKIFIYKNGEWVTLIWFRVH